jgi:hypothetical protein
MKKLVLFFTLIYSQIIMACPYCAGSDGNEGDQYIVYVLAGFIILTYVPFILFSKWPIKRERGGV